MDVAACALGVGAIGHGDASTILGTAGIHQLSMDTPNINPKMVGMTVCHAPGNKWLRLLATNSATPNLDWFIKELGDNFRRQAEKEGISIFTLLDRVIDSVPIGSRGVMYQPYLLPNGERAPFIKPSAKASFTGISESNELADLLRAIYEGVAFAMYDCYQHMPVAVKTLSLTGGGTKSEIWCQIITDVMGIPITISKGTEFGARGAAMNLAVSLDIFKDYESAVSEMVSTLKIYETIEENHLKYQKLYQLYKKLAETSMEYWDMRARILEEVGR